MIEYVKGDLLKSGCDVLVNTVNCVGVMGKGIALQFKNNYPEMFKDYKKYCDQGQLGPGGTFRWFMNQGKQTILCVATKNHWRNPSKLEWVELGIRNIKEFMDGSPQLRSIAIPPLGCGNGGLDWNEVKPLIEKHLGGLNCKVMVYGIE